MIIDLLILSSLLMSNVNCKGLDSPNRDSIFYLEETTNFSNAISISPGITYCASFTSRADTDYYRLSVSSSAIYTFNVVDGMDVFVNVYGYSSSTYAYTLLTSYVVNSFESNFGYNHGFYLDTSIYSYFCYSINGGLNVSNEAYFFSVDLLTARNNGSFEVMSYNVNKGLYDIFVQNDISSNVTSTNNFVPAELSTNWFPSNSSGTILPLIPSEGINTVSTYPYCAVGRQVGTGSTAFLVGPNIVATAAHCLVDAGRVKTSVPQTHIDFGQDYNQTSTVIAHYSKIFFSPTYLYSSQTANYDWAFGILDGYYGNSQGYLGIIKHSSASLSTSTQLIIDGYYGGYNYQSLSYGNYLTNEGNSVIRYQKVTSSGDSGAPVFSTVDSKIVCIHCGSVGSSYSFGTAFESNRFSVFYALFTGVLS